MRILLALSLVACSSPPPATQPKSDPTDGSATTTSAATLTPGVELPEVALTGFVATKDANASVTVTLSGITVDGKLVAPMKDGVVDGAELEGGALGLRIIKLGELAGRLDKTMRLDVALDKRIPYRTLIATLYTLKTAGHRQFGLLARAGAEVVLAPITLPDRSPPDPSTPAGPPPLGLIVTITKTEVKLWSSSMLEGTLHEPKAIVNLAEKSALADLGHAVAEIAARRFPQTRSPGDREIIIQADAAIPMQTIAEVIGTVRATPDGKELFPAVVFSSGFD